MAAPGDPTDARLPSAADAVVIGAGPNGLVAANVLADAGLDVVVLEANDEPGGEVRTAEVTAPGFRNDLFSAVYTLGGAVPVLRDLDLNPIGLPCNHPPPGLAHPHTRRTTQRTRSGKKCVGTG